MSEEATQNFLNRIRIRKDLERFTGGALERYTRINELISQITALDRVHQDFIYEWSELIARSNNELAVHFIVMVPDAFRQLDRDGVLDWVNHAMTTFDNRGLGSAIEILEGVDAFAADFAERFVRCEFEDASSFLRYFVRGLGGASCVSPVTARRSPTRNLCFCRTCSAYFPLPSTISRCTN